MDLNAEQKKIAVQEPKGHFLIKGVAGSGKTSVGIYRITFLLNNYCFAKDDAILVATYNKTLIAYMSYLYDKLGSKELSTLESLFAAPEGRVDIQTVDSLMHSYFRDYLNQNSLKYKLGPPKAMKYEIISEGVSKLKKQYPRVTVLDPKNTVFLLEEIQWIKDCLYLEEEEYQGVDRIGKVKTGSEDQPQRLAKNSETRKAIYELMLFYDDSLRKRGFVSFSDMRIFALQQAQKHPKQKYSHIIVDESQDLTRAQLLFLKQIYNQKDYSSFAFISDTAQSIYAQSWLGTGRSFSSIGFNMGGRSYSLSKNFRTTTQISQAAYSLIENCREIVEDEYFVKPSLIDRQGKYPVFKYYPDEAAQAEYICREIKQLLHTHPEKDIAIIARFKSQLESIKRFLESDGLKCGFFSRKETTFETDSIKLITMHSIKGLEFRVVFIVGLDDRVLPYYSTADPDTRKEEELQERRLLYVGMTRATEMLYMMSSSSPSKFLSDINPGYLRIDRQTHLSRFYNIPTGDYRFKDKIANLHAAEEKIRQWMISELINTYGYPVSCIAVEYPIKEFSRKGFVDIAVQIYEQGRLTPFIFIETKSPGHSLKDGLDIFQAVQEGASDVHISPQKNVVRVRFRVDGKLHEVPSPPKRCFLPIVSRLKILAGMDIAVSRKPQDGRFNVRMKNRDINVRASTIPSIYGENVVLRLLDTSNGIYSLDYLGMSDRDRKKLEAVTARPHGMILSTGPTGSGKSTSLYAILKTINQPDINIVTIEDPVEYRIDDIMQVQLNSKAGMTFAGGLRSILRQDPDVVMVGEIRDLETAKVAVQAALTGHRVLSTLHTNDAAGAISRLLDMGVEPFLVSSVIGVSFAQRLVRMVCPACKTPYHPSGEVLKHWNLGAKVNGNLVHGKGCVNCMGTGYRGRIGIYEVLMVEEKIQDLILKKRTAHEIRKAAVESGNFTTLKENAVEKVLQGVTTLEEVASVVMD